MLPAPNSGVLVGVDRTLGSSGSQLAPVACSTSHRASASSCRPKRHASESKATAARPEGGPRLLAVRDGAHPRRGPRLRLSDARRHGRAILSDSPFLDPTTAVQCSTGFTTGSANWRRVIPDGPGCTTQARHLQVTIPTMDWAAYVHLAFDEIRLASAGSPQVARRMAAALDDLLVVAPADRRPPLEQQRELLLEVIGDTGLARAWTSPGCLTVKGLASLGIPLARLPRRPAVSWY